MLRLIPLGGLGEVGMNCMLLEHAEGALLLDCGVTFPDDDRGVDLLHPSFRYLSSVQSPLLGVFLTHGHEDHIGALPYLLRDYPMPVWGPAHALELATRRIKDRTIGEAFPIDFRPATPGQRYRLGPFEVEPVRVSHSIIEATALCIRSSAGTVLHTGDFKFDPQPADGEPTDEARLEAIGDEGVDLLLSDSTNVGSAGAPGSEAEVSEALEELISDASQRVVVGLFSSNVQRLINLGHIAKRTGRRIGLLGRSLKTHVDTAIQLGHLKWNAEHRVLPDQLDRCPPGELLLLAGGTQAESGSGMFRLAEGTHPALRLDRGDRVILSSRIIPGNDRRVIQMIGQLLRAGMDVHTGLSRRSVHTSGHANRAELTHMIGLTRPRCFIPVHGTRHHLEAHAELAQSLGVSERIVIENGQVAELEAGSLRIAGEVESGRVFVDRANQAIAPHILRQRTQLSRAGIVQLVLAVDTTGAPLGMPRLVSTGVTGLDDLHTETLCSEVERRLRNGSKRWLKQGVELEDELSRFLGSRLERLLGLRPQVRVAVMTAGN